MAKRTPERSKLTRAQTVAFAKKTRSSDEADKSDEKADDADEAPAEKPANPDGPGSEGPPASEKPAEPPEKSAETKPAAEAPKAAPKPDAPNAEAPNAAPKPDAPKAPEPPKAAGGTENPTNLPAPTDIPAGSPDDAADAPGRVPPGDSRSLRRGHEFALVYRRGTHVISRFGTVGRRGQWRVVEYPTSSAAATGYAKECSRFVSDGFVDYRE